MTATQADALRWSLEDLYASADDSRLGDELARAAGMAAEFAKHYRGKVAQLPAAELLDALHAYEALLETAYRPQLFAQLLFAGQTDDPKAQALLNRTRQAGTEALNQARFFDVELKAMPQSSFETLRRAPALSSYAHFLDALRRFAPFTLSEGEEQLSELKNLTGRAAFSQLYTEVTSRLRIPLEVEGEKKELNVSEVRALRSSPDRELRRRATDGLLNAFEASQHVLTYCFNTLFQDHALEVKQRGYSHVAEPTYLEDELSKEAVEALLSATERHFPLAQRYMRLKARALGLDDFSSHDLLAPLGKSERKVPFNDGRKMVLDAFTAFDPRFGKIASEFFDKRWIDVLPRPGKRDGAFCSGMLPSLHPYVLLNYSERIEDVSTLAHELGHGIHFYLARRNSPLNFWPTTPMAETASVFAELLLMKRLLENEQDRSVRRELLAMRIEDILSTVFNQVSYTRWEQKAHAARDGGVVSAEDYSTLWMEERKRLYGDAVRFFPRDRWGWVSIPHFVHYRFYCYSYAFGQLLVLALFRKYEAERDGFVPRYVELLSKGGSDTPAAMLASLGIDLAQPAFFEGGFATLEGLLDEFEALL